MNILLLLRFFSPSLGGSELVFCTIAEILAKNGHKVWVLTNKIEGVNYPQHPNIKIIFLSSHLISDVKHWKQEYKMQYFFSSIKFALSLIKKEKIDIIHSNPFEPVYAGSFLSFLTGIPHIIAIHDITPIKKKFVTEWLKQKQNSKYKAFVSSIYFKFLLKLKHSAIHTVSETSKEDLKKMGANEPIFVINNAIPITSPIEVKTNSCQFVSVGRLVIHKNLEIVINAIKEVKKSFPQITLVIVGEGSHRKNLEKLVLDLELEDNIIFKGQVSEEEKNQLIASSLALIFPSLFEGFGMVILEAYNQKKPSLVSDVKPLSNLVEDKKTGLVIAKNDKKEWANAIEFVLKEPTEARRMGENGRNILKEKYTLEQMYDRINDMYYKVINGLT